LKYALILFLLIISVHTFSYAKYNWVNNNKLGAAGALLLAIAQVAVPTAFLLLR
jgi:hypothetical protein